MLLFHHRRRMVAKFWSLLDKLMARIDLLLDLLTLRLVDGADRDLMRAHLATRGPLRRGRHARE